MDFIPCRGEQGENAFGTSERRTNMRSEPSERPFSSRKSVQNYFLRTKREVPNGAFRTSRFVRRKQFCTLFLLENGRSGRSERMLVLRSLVPNAFSSRSPRHGIFWFPASNYPWEIIFLKTQFLLVPSQPIGFRGKWTSYSSSWPRITPEKPFF